MLGKLWTRMENAERRFRRSWGKDVETPSGRFWAKVHYHLFDHAFLRILWTNFWPVAPGVWRSNQPTHARFERYKAMGIRTVINLRGPDKHAHYKFEKESVEALGLTLVDAKLWARHAAPRDAILEVLEALRDAERPMMFHCKSGADRAGFVAAMYQMVFDDVPVQEARKQLGLKFLHLKFTKTGVQDYVLDVYEARLAHGAIAFEEWIRHEYRHVALFKAYKAGVAPDAIARQMMETRTPA
ncbi:tyrosine-protein phosphatase [Thetidibacter halocola]|uniref:Tyrosine-protein phosphatase n=1 Tax=Thetidibacter halocola TaxID=2827239 RepID=A0A8J7WCI4_9RHOB|nr:tyrosine-protein phosphatase [Thetidibacter halocola]MBS0125110.1 tyrosine-protein phosphatase [Thetidibacter halocola]